MLALDSKIKFSDPDIVKVDLDSVNEVLTSGWLARHRIFCFKRITFHANYKFMIKSILYSIIMAFMLIIINLTGTFEMTLAILFSLLLILLKGFSHNEYKLARDLIFSLLPNNK